MAPIIRDEFVNESGGWIGVVTINARGDRTGVAVPPGESIWLSEEEQVETANAPRADADNPLVNGQLVLRTKAEEVKNRRPLRPSDEAPVTPATPADQPPVKPVDEPEVEDETGATPEPGGEPEEGTFAPGEEVATPEAAEAPKPARRRRAPAGATAE